MPSRTDDNQGEIVDAILKIGGDWIGVSEARKAGYDGLILWRGRSLVTEIKNGNLPPSRRMLTDNELKTKARCEAKGVPYLILLSVDDAIATLREFR